MIRKSILNLYKLRTLGERIPLTQSAIRSFGFWDMTKSKHKKSPEHMKNIQMHQSPIDIKNELTEHSEALKLQIDYNPVKVSADKKHAG